MPKNPSSADPEAEELARLEAEEAALTGDAPDAPDAETPATQESEPTFAPPPSEPVADYPTLRVAVKTYLTLGNKDYTPNTEADVPATPEVLSAIAAGLLERLDDDEAPKGE